MDFKTILNEFMGTTGHERGDGSNGYEGLGDYNDENEKNIRSYEASQKRRNKGKAIYILQLEEMLIVASENQQTIIDIRKDINQAKKDLDGKDFDTQMDYVDELNNKWGITSLSNMNIFYPQYTLQVYCI